VITQETQNFPACPCRSGPTRSSLYFTAKGIGPEPVSPKTTAPGQYRNQTVTVTFTGQWTLQLIIRSDAFDETSVTFPVAVH
jgi:hypothetical protein